MIDFLLLTLLRVVRAYCYLLGHAWRTGWDSNHLLCQRCGDEVPFD